MHHCGLLIGLQEPSLQSSAGIVGGSVAFYFLIFAGISALIFLRDKPAEEEDDDAYVEEYVETYDEEDTQPQEPQADMYDDNRNGQ